MNFATTSIYLRGVGLLRCLIAPKTITVVIFAVGGIALVPGYMNAFLITSLMMDGRPPRKRLDRYPGITILTTADPQMRSQKCGQVLQCSNTIVRLGPLGAALLQRAGGGKLW